MERIFQGGWSKSKRDTRDLLHSRRMIRRVPDKVDFSLFKPPVADQGNRGSCVGHGEGAEVTLNAAKQGLIRRSDWQSKNWIYNGARMLEGMLAWDAGAESRDGYAWMFANGCLEEMSWPYDDSKDLTRDPREFKSLADKYPLRIKEYVRVDEGLEGMLDAIAAGFAVSVGSAWPQSWMDARSDGILPDPSKSYASGGHERFYFGYDIPSRVFFMQNSWGVEWAKEGCAFEPFSAIEWFKAKYGYDAYYTILEWVEPGPEPPTPSPNGAALALGKIGNAILKSVCPNSEIIVKTKGGKK